MVNELHPKHNYIYFFYFKPRLRISVVCKRRQNYIFAEGLFTVEHKYKVYRQYAYNIQLRILRFVKFMFTSLNELR